MIRTAVWGTGNVGRAAIRAVDAHPELELAAVIVHNPDKVGRDAGELADLDRSLGVAATDDIDSALENVEALVYAASGEIRPDDALVPTYTSEPLGKAIDVLGRPVAVLAWRSTRTGQRTVVPSAHSCARWRTSTSPPRALSHATGE